MTELTPDQSKAAYQNLTFLTWVGLIGVAGGSVLALVTENDNPLHAIALIVAGLAAMVLWVALTGWGVVLGTRAAQHR